jgi:hypothetical protein
VKAILELNGIYVDKFYYKTASGTVTMAVLVLGDLTQIEVIFKLTIFTAKLTVTALYMPWETYHIKLVFTLVNFTVKLTL